MNSALASATGPKLEALLKTLSLELLSLDQILESPEPGGRPFNNNAVFAVAVKAAESQQPQELILRVQNTHSWRRRRVTENEVAVMRWVSLHDVPLVPQVLAFSADASTSPLGCEFILMEKIQGQSLSQTWHKLSVEERSRYMEQLRAWLARLRAVPRPPGGGPCLARFGLAGDGGVVAEDAGWWCHEGPPLPREAGTSFASLASAVLREAVARLGGEGDLRDKLRSALREVGPEAIEADAGLRAAAKCATEPTSSRSALRECLQRAMDGPVALYRAEQEMDGRPLDVLCCCHNDLHVGNLMVKDGDLTGVLDWEAASWGFADVDCQAFGELAGKSGDPGDCGSGLPVAPGAALRRLLMALVQEVPSLYFSIASWQGGCNDAAGRAALDIYSRIVVDSDIWDKLKALGLA